MNFFKWNNFLEGECSWNIIYVISVVTAAVKKIKLCDRKYKGFIISNCRWYNILIYIQALGQGDIAFGPSALKRYHPDIGLVYTNIALPNSIYSANMIYGFTMALYLHLTYSRRMQ